LGGRITEEGKKKRPTTGRREKKKRRLLSVRGSKENKRQRKWGPEQSSPGWKNENVHENPTDAGANDTKKCHLVGVPFQNPNKKIKGGDIPLGKSWRTPNFGLPDSGKGGEIKLV